MTASPPGRLKGLLANLLTAAAAVALTAAGIELAFGLVNRWGTRPRPSRPHGEMSVFTRYHPILGWDGTPNLRNRLLLKTVTHNSLGNRSPEVSIAKPQEMKRVVVLGDSQAWGLGVGDDETIAAQLEARLNATGAQRWQAINLGVSGYGTDQAYLKYLLQGARYEPDAVVAVVFKNDALENAATRVWGVEKPRFYFEGDRPCLGNLSPPKVPGWPEDAVASADGVRLLGRRIELAWSETYRFFQKRSWRLKPAPRPDPDDLARLRLHVPCMANRRQYTGDGARIMLLLLRRLDALTRAHGGRLLVVFVPRPVECRKPGRPTYYDAVRPEVERSGIVSIDLCRYALADGLGAGAMFLGSDSHLSAAGSARVARALAEALR